MFGDRMVFRKRAPHGALLLRNCAWTATYKRIYGNCATHGALLLRNCAWAVDGVFRSRSSACVLMDRGALFVDRVSHLVSKRVASPSRLRKKHCSFQFWEHLFRVRPDKRFQRSRILRLS